MKADELMNIAQEIRQSRVVEKKVYFTAKYPEFARTHPQLMIMAIDPTADFRHLSFLLQQLKAVESNHVTFEDASIKVGEVFAEQYVKPIVDRLDAERAASDDA